MAGEIDDFNWVDEARSELDYSLLKPEQAEAVKKMKEFLNSDEDLYLFTGPPGSGKTFTIKYVLDGIAIPETTVGGTLSHAAKWVLGESLEGYANCYTIAQLLGQEPMTDNRTGKQVFEVDQQKYNDGKLMQHIKGKSIVIVDECSMVTNNMYNAIMNFADKDAKIIFMGDQFQLPPVGEEEKPLVFQIPNRSELTKSVRFSGAIGEVAVYFKAYQDYLIDAGEYGSLLDLYSFRMYRDEPESLVWFYSDEELFKQYAIDRFDKDLDGTRVLAYRNATIKEYNTSIRSHFINADSPIVRGEKIILNSPYETRGGWTSDGEEINNLRLHNGEVYEILDFSIETLPITTTEPKDDGTFGTRIIKDTYLTFEAKVKSVVTDIETVVNILHPSEEAKYEHKLDQLVVNAKQDRSLWSQYYGFKENFLGWSRMYAMTTHKSQGQSINNVFVMANDILGVERIDPVQKMQSLYVAATRARKELHVLL